MTVINFTIDRLTPKKIKGQCTGWSVFPRPGSFIDFLTLDEKHFYAQIESVNTDKEDSNKLILTLVLISGTPDTKIKKVKQISTASLFNLLKKDEFPPKIPLEICGLLLDLERAGKVIYIKPDEKNLHQTIIKSLSNADLPIIILDPIGLEWSFTHSSEFIIGKEFGLSIQELGVNRFIEWIVEGLPKTVQLEASKFLLTLIPPTPDFIPLQYFVHHPLLKNHPLSSIILHRLYQFHKNRIFAASTQNALTSDLLETGGIINISSVSTEMMHHIYEGLLRTIARHTFKSNAKILLVAPEIATFYSNEFINNAKNTVFIVSKTSKPWNENISDRFEEINTWGETGIEIAGQITDGRTLFLPYISIQESECPDISDKKLSNSVSEEDINFHKETIEPTQQENLAEPLANLIQEENVDQSLNLEALATLLAHDEGNTENQSAELNTELQNIAPDLSDLNLEAFDENSPEPLQMEDFAEPLATLTQEETDDQLLNLESLGTLLSLDERNIENQSAELNTELQSIAPEPTDLNLKAFDENNIEPTRQEFNLSFIPPVSADPETDKDLSNPFSNLKEKEDYIESPACDMEYFFDRETSVDFDHNDKIDFSTISSDEAIEDYKNNPFDKELSHDKPDANLSEELSKNENTESQNNNFIVIDTQQLWDIDLSLIKPGTEDKENPNSEFYVLLHKEIPNITKGIPLIPILPCKSELKFEHEIKSLDMEDNMIGTMAPDLIETVHEKQLKSIPDNQMELEAEYQSGSTEITHLIKVKGELNTENEEALAYLQNMLYSSPPESPYTDNTTNPTDNNAEIQQKEILVDNFKSGANSEINSSIKDLLENSSHEESIDTTPVYSLDEGILMDSSLPPSFQEILNLEEPVMIAEPDVFAINHQEDGIEDFKEETFNLELVNNTDIIESEEENILATALISELTQKINLDLPEPFDHTNQDDDLEFNSKEAVFSSHPQPELIDNEANMNHLKYNDNQEATIFNQIPIVDIQKENLEFYPKETYSSKPQSELIDDNEAFVMPLVEEQYTIEDIALNQISQEEDVSTISFNHANLSNPEQKEEENIPDDVFKMINEDLPDFSLDLDFVPETENSTETVLNTKQKELLYIEDEDIDNIDLSLDLDFDILSDTETSLTETQDSSLPVHKTSSYENSNIEFKPGELVFHKRYGEGVIKKVISMDEKQVILNINFKSFGKRLLDPSLTHLEKVS